jgi:hypothetical protein
MEKAVNIARALVIRTAAAVLLGVGVAAAPALTYAQHAGGGHAGGGGGGAHFGGGGGFHAAPGPHFSGGFHGGGYAGGAHYARPGFAPGHVGGAYYGGHAGGAYYAGHVGTAYWHGGHYWGGGYWHGGYWPHVWYGPGWAWFYPALPIGYATFWWGGLPYYYYNNLYYTWNPNYNGYVVTDPPPSAGSADAAGAPEDSGAAMAAAPAGQQQDYAPQPAPASGAASDVYVYPRNGQTEQQTSTDRYECHSWAVNQTGFDPTRSSQPGTGSSPDYRRAMIACLDARGYSAR